MTRKTKKTSDTGNTTISITQTQAEEISILEKAALLSQRDLANAQIEVMRYEQARDDQARRVVEARKAYQDKLREVALDHGIDPEDPSKGLWHLDLVNRLFTKKS